MSKLLIGGFFILLTAGIMLRSTPVKNVDVSQLNQMQNGTYIVNAEIQPNGDGSVVVRDESGNSISGYYSGDKVGYGKVEVEKSGGSFMVKKVTTDKGAMQSGVLVETRIHNDQLYGRVANQEGGQWVTFNQSGITGYQKP